MHIPDGYLAPVVYGASYALAIPLWAIAFKKLKNSLDEETLPLIASLSALSFIVMMFNIPVPGGTSGHALGVALIAMIFSPWIGFLSISLVLFIQALIFGDGGLTSFAANSLGMGFFGAFSAYFVYQKTKDLKYAPFLAGWVSAVASSIFIAVILGIEPSLGVDGTGKPLYFPFGLDVTIPAIVGSHILFFGIVEGIFTQLTFKFLLKIEPEALKAV